MPPSMKTRPETDFRRWLVAAAMALAILAAPATAPADVLCDWDSIEPVPKQRADVSSLQLRRPYLGLSLEKGVLYGLQTCDRIVGLLFVGEGEVQIGSPGPQRTPQLHNRSHDLPGTALIDAAILIGADGSVEELLEDVGGLVPGAVPPSVWSLAQARMNGFLSSNADGWRPPGEVLASPTTDLGGVLIEVRTLGVRSTRPERSLEVLSPWFTWVWAPTGPLNDLREPGLLLRRPTGSTRPLLYGGFVSEDTIADQSTAFALETVAPDWDLTAVSLALAASGPIGPDRVLEKLQGDASLDLTANAENPHMVLALSAGVQRVYGAPWAEIRVKGTSQVAADGQEIELDWLRSGDRLFVTIPDAPAVGDSVQIRVQWEGNILEPRGRTAIRLLGTEAWYPRTPGVDRHRFTASVAVPTFWSVIATGHQIGEEVNGRVKVITSRARRPVRSGAVAIADVRTEVLKPPSSGLPLVRVHRSSEQSVPNARIEKELWERMEVLRDLLGPYPWTELEIVERGPGTRGYEGLPGIIALPVFDSPPNQIVTSGVGSDSLLGSLARQWLEADRGTESYHDRWLVEGLTTWARCLALEAGGLGARCQGQLSSWRQSWIDSMTGAGIGSDLASRDLLAGAIWLDVTSGAGWSNSRIRGPLVMHALRLLVGDEVVQATLRALAQAESDVSLASFLRVIQEATGQDLRSYVYGWVLNTPSLPTARLRYRLVQEGETWTLSGLGVIDSGREGSPRLPLPTPMLLAYEVAGEMVLTRLILTETEAALTIKDLPMKPRNIKLDPGKSFPGKTIVERIR